MVNPRLELALERIAATDWRQFEKFASEFLVEAFPQLRTTASMSGDRGRDAELVGLPGDEGTKFQYSVTSNWKSKISATLDTLTKNFPDTSRLIYCTNQSVGAEGDELSNSAWTERGIQLHIYDRGWFIEREATSPIRRTASQELIEAFVEPLLKQRNIVRGIATPLSEGEARVALLQLALNDSDRKRDQSLTKTSFDSLVLAALNGSSSENAKSFTEIVGNVSEMLPSAETAQIKGLVESALGRLSKKNGPVKAVKPKRVFHISYEAKVASEDDAAAFLLQQDSLERDLAGAIFGIDESLDDDPDALLGEAKILRGALEHLLMHGGESFARAITEEALVTNAEDEVRSLLSAYEMKLRIHRSEAEAAIARVIAQPSERGSKYLERLLGAYTLFAFLQQTPDVQKTLSQIFDGGEVWLDTSVVLPLIAEMAMDDDSAKPFTHLLRATIDSGMHLYVTGGVIEEINRHLDNCLRYVQLGTDWRNQVPFVYKAYIFSGRSEDALGEWIEELKGPHRPELDLENSLEEIFGILKRDLLEYSDAAEIELRGAVQQLLIDSHSRRRAETELGFGVVERLVAHDVENVVGIIELRRRSAGSAFGYEAWWLTLDRTAQRLQGWLRDRLGDSAPHTPAISPDYFSQMLRFGPLRRNAATHVAPALPLSFDVQKFESIPPELIDLAKETRVRYADYGERRIRREVRDALDRSRQSTGPSRLSVLDYPDVHG